MRPAATRAVGVCETLRGTAASGRWNCCCLCSLCRGRWRSCGLSRTTPAVCFSNSAAREFGAEYIVVYASTGSEKSWSRKSVILDTGPPGVDKRAGGEVALMDVEQKQERVAAVDPSTSSTSRYLLTLWSTFQSTRHSISSLCWCFRYPLRS